MTQEFPSEDTISDHQISEIITSMDKLAWKNDWTRLSQIYADLQPEQMTVVEMIAYLRTSFSYKNKITSWVAFRDRCKVELERRGRDCTRVLRGLG